MRGGNDVHGLAGHDRIAGIVDDTIGRSESSGDFEVRAEVSADLHSLQLDFVIGTDDCNRDAVRSE